MWLLEYLQHRQICQDKQRQRTSRIAAYSAGHTLGLSTADRTILEAPINELVRDVQSGQRAANDILHAYTKAALQAQNATNCITEIMATEAEGWLRDGSINLKGPLAGIPVSLKDSINVGGFDTSVGYSSKCFRPHAQDGAMVRLLKDAGAVPYVKTALPVTLLSFESTNDVWGRAKNPHNTNYSPGGSTGGESALLAYGGSRIGIGSDVAGSVRVPAHFSGCYSIRCSIGRWPKAGVDTSMPGQEGVQSVFSPMARTLHDLTYFTRSVIQMRPWEYDTTVHPLPWRSSFESYYQDTKRLTFGVLRTDGIVYPSPACERALEMTVASLRAAGHNIVEITPPSAATPYDGLVLGAQLLNSDGTQVCTSFMSAGESLDAGVAQMARIFNLPRIFRWAYYLFVRYIQQDNLWAGLIKDLRPKTAAQQWSLVAKREAYKATWFEWWNALEKSKDSNDQETGVDVLLMAPNPTPAVPHDGMRDAIAACGYTFLWNILDYTSGVLPVTKVDPERDTLSSGFHVGKLNGIARGAYCHYDAVKMAGLPVGVQVVGRRLEEEKVLSVMQRVQDALEAHGEVYKLLQVP